MTKLDTMLRMAQYVAVAALTAIILGFSPFWQWFTLGYATGWTILISAGVAVVAVAIYAIYFINKIANPSIIGGSSLGLFCSILIAFFCLISSQIVDEGRTIFRTLEDGSTALYTIENDRYYNPFGPTIETMSPAEGEVRASFQMQCGDRMCTYTGRGDYEVSQSFVMSTVIAGQPDRFDYEDVVRTSIIETIIADRPEDSWDLEDGVERRINQRLGLADDADCPIKVRLRLERDDLMPEPV